MAIIYSESKTISYSQLDTLTDSIGWGVRGEDAWITILQKSSFIISAWNGDRLVGFARILEDGVMCMVYDVMVHPDAQGQSIGHMLMERICAEIDSGNYQSVGLFAWQGNPFNQRFYEKFKFQQVGFGMKRSKKI